MSIDEVSRLEGISAKSLYARTANARMIRYSFKILSRYLTGSEVLEMGPAEGLMTELLMNTGKCISVVDGSRAFCSSLSERFPTIDVAHALFEDYVPGRRFDTIVLGHVLEHVKDPVAILRRVKESLNVGGRVFAAVPNARSIHRQAAVLMGMLPQEDALNDMDRHHGHRRVFNPESFRNTFYQAGLAIEVFGGYWLKPVSNKQIEEAWSDEMLDAFMELGERYPDIAGEIYVVATRRD